MTIYSANANVQTSITETPRGRAKPGERPQANAYTHRPITGVDPTEDTSQISTIEITASANLDEPSVTIDGAEFGFVSSTTDALTAAALAAALTAAIDEGDLLALILASAAADGTTVTLAFADYRAHTITFNAAGSTTATVTDTQDAAESINYKAGVFVSTHPTEDNDPTYRSVHLPASASEALVGVTLSSPYPKHNTPSNPYGLDGDAGEEWPKGQPMELARDGEICVRIAGNVGDGDPVYAICDPASSSNGYAVASETFTGGAHQVTRGDVQFNGTDDVGLNVDGYVVSVASNTSDDQTAADLRDEWNNDTFAASIATASIDISGAESYIILTFADYSEHIVQVYAPATATIAGLTNTTEAAAQTATSKRREGAFFIETRTLAQGDAYIDLG